MAAAQQRPHPADYARHVAVAQEQQPPFERGFDVNLVHGQNPQRRAVQYGSLDGELGRAACPEQGRGVPVQCHSQGVREALRPPHLGLLQRQAAFGGQRGGIHQVGGLIDHPAQHPLEHRVAQQVRVQFAHLAGITQAHPHHRRAGHLRGKGAQALPQLQVGPQPAVLFR